MKVEIWSDIICPYCYIGKRKFEAALKEFPQASKIEVVWRSYQLDPSLEAGNKIDLYQYMADIEGISYEEAVASRKELAKEAQKVGLTYNFDKSILTNTFDGHRLIHLATKHNLGDIAEEHLFKAYFTEGKDISNHEVLLQLGKEIGLNEKDIVDLLKTNSLKEEVEADIDEAEKLGLYYVPYFLFDRKHVVTGVVTTENFLQVLNKSLTDQNNSITNTDKEIITGKSCSLDGTCS